MVKTKTQDDTKAAEQEVVNSGQIDEFELKVRRTVHREIEGMTVDQFRGAFGELYAKIANDILEQGKDKSLGKVPGFLLEATDPFASAVERVFVQHGGVGSRVVVRTLEKSKLPMVLPFKDPATKSALESYVFRAEGAGDIERSQRAKAALAKCK